MNKDIKTDWLFLLRSGEIRQGMGALNDIEQDEFCCLGVLCEMAEAHGVVEKNSDYPNGYYGGTSGVLPQEVYTWAGLKNVGHPNDPNIDGISLSDRNDNGASFAEISDLIEKHL